MIDGYWTYRHNNSILHDLLSREFTEHLDSEVDLTKLENYHRLANGDANIIRVILKIVQHIACYELVEFKKL